MNCNETLFELISSIEAYPFGGSSSLETMSVHEKSVSEEKMGLDMSSMIQVPMKIKSCSPSEKRGVELPGDSYEVTVSWEIAKLNKDTYNVLQHLYEKPNHLILRTYDSKGYFIRCEEEGYDFSYEEKDGLLECTVTIHNKNGLQRIL
ncbi:MAG: hypothetical protein IJY59_03520 [Bacteroidaceae bacterium]|nr:hypothetical protein [Bacteroidaceae bacterium]